MEYPRNPPAPKEQLQPQRPSMSNVYTPGFTIEGGRTGLTHEEYLRAIRDHSPLVESCLNKTRWWVLSTTILSGISAMFVAKRRGLGRAGTIFAVTLSPIFTMIAGVNMIPQLRCEPSELNALNQSLDLALYGPWKRDDGSEQLFRPKEMHMDEAKYREKGFEPPEKQL